MEIITWDDIRRGTLAIVLVIVPTVLLGTYMAQALQSYQITGPGLWELKRKGTPDALIEPLHELRLKPFFFKFRLKFKTIYHHFICKFQTNLKYIPLNKVFRQKQFQS